MEIFGLFIPLIAILICGLILLGFFGWGLFVLLLQIGVIVRAAQKPPHIDAGNYDLRQGRDVGKDE